MMHSSPGSRSAAQTIETGLLGAGGDQDLAALVGQTVLALEFGDDGVFEFRRAVDRGVARDAACGSHRRPHRRMKAGVSKSGSPAPESDYVVAFGLEFGGSGRDREGGGGFDLLNALGQGNGHEGFLCEGYLGLFRAAQCTKNSSSVLGRSGANYVR